jgi:hypothetical protein
MGMTIGHLEPAPSIVELRQYFLHRGRRDELIELFDREFVETQEALGMRVIGQFRDIDRPNHFVWLRGFADQQSRRDALTRFYSGPIWRTHGARAAATMIDSSDVHQIRASSEPDHRLRVRAPKDRDVDGHRGSILVIVAHRHSEPASVHGDLIREHLVPTIEDAGIRPIGLYTSDRGENPYPALPVRLQT